MRPKHFDGRFGNRLVGRKHGQFDETVPVFGPLLDQRIDADLDRLPHILVRIVGQVVSDELEFGLAQVSQHVGPGATVADHRPANRQGQGQTPALRDDRLRFGG